MNLCRSLRCSTASLGLGAMMFLTGCGGYALEGRVVQGSRPAVRVVGENDPGLDGPPLEGVQVSATLDPHDLNAKPLGSATSGPDGRFSLPVEALGAGMLEYEVEVAAGRQGYQSAGDIFPMPKRSQRLLITLPPGEGGYETRPDLMQQTLDEGTKLWNQ